VSPERPRYLVLDAYRFLAAAGVMAYHFANHLSPLRGVHEEVLTGFRLFVDFFFALSGFVLMHTYGDRIRSWPAYLDFLRRRLARIYPLHFGVTLVYVCAGLAAAAAGAKLNHPETFDLGLIAPNLLLVQAWGVVDRVGLNVVSWSISSEFFVYLLFPLFVALLARLGAQRTLLAALLFAGAFVAWRSLAGLRPWLEATYDLGSLRAVPTFLAGMAVQRLVAAQPPRPIGWAAAHGLAATIPLLILVGAPENLVVALFPLAIFLIARAERGGAPTLLQGRLFSALGDASYGVYMLHSLVAIAVVALARLSHRNDPAFLLALGALGMTLSTLLALASYRWFETPLRRLLSGAATKPARVEESVALARGAAS